MSGLLTVSSLKEVFKTLLEEAANRQQVAMAQETEFYLVNLLSEFVTVEKLFTTQDGQQGPEPLAVLYHRALQQGRDERIRTLRRLGDISLYTVGFFGDFLRERIVGTAARQTGSHDVPARRGVEHGVHWNRTAHRLARY